MHTTAKVTKLVQTIGMAIIDNINRLQLMLSDLSVTGKLLLLAIFTLIFYFLARAFHNYRLYMSLGPGGVTYGLRGWLFNWLIRPVASTDLVSLGIYDEPKARKEYGEMGSRSFLRDDDEKGEGLRVRGKARPKVPYFAAPQRQQPGTGNNGAFAEQQEAFFHHLVSLNPSLLRVDTSGQEKRGPALFLHHSVHAPEPVDGHTRGEIAHFHTHTHMHGFHGPPDGSGHVTLSLEDAKEVVGKGWGQRHMMSGRLGARVVGIGFTMAYAPQDEEELEIMKRIFVAGARYMAFGREIKA